MGAIWHVAAVSFEKEFGVELKHIPYPNGSADIAAALTGGHIDATIADPSSYKSQVDAGEMKILWCYVRRTFQHLSRCSYFQRTGT